MRRLQQEAHLFEKSRGVFQIFERAPRSRPVANRALCRDFRVIDERISLAVFQNLARLGLRLASRVNRKDETPPPLSTSNICQR